MEYQITKTCKDCKHIDIAELTKVEAAFEIYDSLKTREILCSKWGSLNWELLGRTLPIIDKELLDIWGNDYNLSFMQQDEHLLLAEIAYFPMILNAIDENKYLKSKIFVLVEAICVLLYDNTVSPEEYTEKENKERKAISELVIPELIQRKNIIIEANKYIWEYLKDVVYPQIGLDFLLIKE